MNIDASGLYELSVDLSSADARLIPRVRSVVSRGALNIKGQLQSEASASASFRPVAASIGYDLTDGGAMIEAEIGPDRSRGGGAGLLGAYWGWSRGGGGTLPDPMIALGEEEPRFVENLARAAGYVFQ